MNLKERISELLTLHIINNIEAICINIIHIIY